jgi:hypothetical protein
MKVDIKGEPDDLIRRCDGCRHCIFEDILTDEQRTIKTIKKKNPKIHIHRIVVEQLCGKHYDKVCPMKYAAMKASVDDRTAVQLAVVKNYIWDMGRRYKKKIRYTTAMKKWTMEQDLGRKEPESRASRYDDVWERGLRYIVIDDEQIENQILTADLIYEIIMTNAKDYKIWLKMLDKLVDEHKERHDNN